MRLARAASVFAAMALSTWSARGEAADAPTPTSAPTASPPLPPPPVWADVPLPARIDAVEVYGLVRAKQYVVLRELPWHAGQVVSRSAFDLGVTRLWNTPLFSRVAARVVRKGPTVVAVFELEERWPLTPLVEFQQGGNATWFHLGASHRNLDGRYLELEGFYEYFNGQSGGRVWYRDARLFDKRIELRVVLDRLMRPRPDYVVRTTRGRLELNHLVLDDRIKYGIRIDALSDDFFAPLDGVNPALPATLEAFIVEPTLRVGRVDNMRLRDRGVSLETRIAIGYTTQKDAAVFRRFTAELNANEIAGEHWNFGLRMQAGGVTGQPGEMQFFLGGLDLLRGYVDNYFKATSYVSYNADIKYVVLDTTWLGMIPTVFSDGAVIVRNDGTHDSAFSVGPGLIFVIPKFADSQLRFDLAVPLRPPYHPGVGVGSSVFF